MAADIGGAIVMAGFVVAYSWVWKGARASRTARTATATAGARMNRAAPMACPSTEARRANEVHLKAEAIRACRAAAEDYVDEHPGPVGRLLAKVTAWEAAAGPSEDYGWSVYRQLGLLRQVVNEPLLRDPEAAVLQAVTSVAEPVD